MSGIHGRDRGIRQGRPYQPTGSRERAFSMYMLYVVGGGKWGRLIEFGKSGVCVFLAAQWEAQALGCGLSP